MASALSYCLNNKIVAVVTVFYGSVLHMVYILVSTYPYLSTPPSLLNLLPG